MVRLPWEKEATGRLVNLYKLSHITFPGRCSLGYCAPHVCGPQLSGSTLFIPLGKGVSESMSMCAPSVLCIRDSYILGPLFDPGIMILVKQVEVGGSQNLWEAF